MQRRRNNGFEISSLLGFADSWLNSCAGSCVAVLIGSRMSHSSGPRGKQLQSVKREMGCEVRGECVCDEEDCHGSMCEVRGKDGCRALQETRETADVHTGHGLV